MPRPKLEIADIFRTHGLAWQQANAGHVSLSQLKVMSAIEACRTEALGGHVAGCAKCGHRHIAYNSCKNRHCPKCQGPAARDWMAARAEDLLPVQYFHVVFTLPAEIARIAYWNKQAVYSLLFKASAETVMTIAADPKRLGARVGMTSVLHTWGSALTHHPHNLLCGPSSRQREILGLIRYLGNELRIPIVALGTKDAWLALRLDDQLENLFQPFLLSRWDDGSETGRLLASFETVVPLREPSGLGLPALRSAIMERSEGLIGEMHQLLSSATAHALMEGRERIVEDDLVNCIFHAPSYRRQMIERELRA